MIDRDIPRVLRRLWRRCFRPEPPIRLDGPVIQIRALFVGNGRLTWDEWLRQLAIRGGENRVRAARWKAGYRI